MKFVVVMALLLIFVAACNSLQVYEPAVYEPIITYTPEPVPLPVFPPPVEPPIAESEPQPIERTWQPMPYLTRLVYYRNGMYTDGTYAYRFSDDGAIIVQGMREDIAVLHEAERPPCFEHLRDTDEFLQIVDIANANSPEWMWEWQSDTIEIIHVQNGTLFLHVNQSHGGGSGESFWHNEDLFFFSIAADGEFTDFGELHAVHIIYHDGYFYYVELPSRIGWTPGTGQIKRVDMNGQNPTVIVEEITLGPFSISNNRIFYSSLADGLTYSVDLQGGGRLQVSERIAPRYHRPWLEFYGSTIINRSWLSPGYGIGIFVIPSDIFQPAIMDEIGNSIVTFPPELVGHNPFTVTHFGYEYTGDRHTRRPVTFFLILESNTDGQKWVYVRTADSSMMSQVFHNARLQHDERGNLE